MNQYYLWLINLKGYSVLTAKLYLRYANLLIDNDLDYKKLLFGLDNLSNNTKRVVLSAIKKYYQYINDNRHYQILLPTKNKIVCDYLTIEEYNKLIQYVINKNKVNLVKLITLRMLFETGIRSFELLSISVNNIQDNKITILGKNNKERYIYLSNSLALLLSSYIVKYKIDNKLFNFGYKSLYKKISLLGKKVLNKKLTPHMFRRGFATYCINNNIGIYELSLMMGHDNINTTKLYLRNDNKVLLMQTLFK